MIRLVDIWRTYDVGGRPLHALRAIDEEIGAGEPAKIPPRHGDQASAPDPASTRPMPPSAPGGRPAVQAPELGTTASSSEPSDPPPGSVTYDLGPTAPPSTDIDRRTGIAEVEHAMSEEQARRQAERCLVCHVDTIYARVFGEEKKSS